MKIVLLGSLPQTSPFNYRGGLIKLMVSCGCDVIASAPASDALATAKTEEIQREVRDLGARFVPLPIKRAKVTPFYDLKTLVHLRRLFKHERPDALLSYNLKPVVYGSLAAKYARVPSCFAMMTGAGKLAVAGNPMTNMVLPKMLKSSLDYNEKIFFQNRDDITLLRERGIIPNDRKAVLINGSGVDLEYFDFCNPVTEPITFVMIARLLKAKGVREFVAAAEIVHERYPNVKAILVGPKDNHSDAIGVEEINSWKSRGVVKYVGAQRDVRPYLRQASVFVLPSHREGTPRTSLEAMAMGRPVITTDAPGCRETVTEGYNGYLVPVKDPMALARAMMRFVDRPELIELMGQQAFERAFEKYNVKNINRKIVRELGLNMPDVESFSFEPQEEEAGYITAVG